MTLKNGVYFIPLCIENAQSNVSFSLKSAHEMGRLNEKRCKVLKSHNAVP